LDCLILIYYHTFAADAADYWIVLYLFATIISPLTRLLWWFGWGKERVKDWKIEDLDFGFILDFGFWIWDLSWVFLLNENSLFKPVL